MTSAICPSGSDAADRMLREYAACSDAGKAEQLLEALLVDYARPAIRRIVTHKLGFAGAAEAQDIEDVSSEVLVELIARLRTMRQGAGEGGIGAFAGYTAVAALHACNEYVRRKHPNRHRLKTRLRYLLSNEKGLAIWEEANGWMCGLSRWQSERRPAPPRTRLERWTEELADVPRGHSLAPRELLTRIFAHFGGPLDLDELVPIVAAIWGIEDAPPAPEQAAHEIGSSDPDPGERLDLSRWMAALWAEIRELPAAQRMALLLNLRTSGGAPAVSLLPVTGVAGMREIAAALEMAVEELAALWNRLPLEDLAIAERLGVSRQRVINLRKSARERLARRMSRSNMAPGLASTL